MLNLADNLSQSIDALAPAQAARGVDHHRAHHGRRHADHRDDHRAGRERLCGTENRAARHRCLPDRENPVHRHRFQRSHQGAEIQRSAHGRRARHCGRLSGLHAGGRFGERHRAGAISRQGADRHHFHRPHCQHGGHRFAHRSAGPLFHRRRRSTLGLCVPDRRRSWCSSSSEA